jgi:hypothetical protein
METFKLVSAAHYVITGDGKLVVDRQKERWECGK